MALFVIGIILLLLAVGMFIFGGKSVEEGYPSARPWGLVPLIIGLILIGVASVRTVSPGDVAIPVTFGSTGDPLPAGMHVVAPWTSLDGISVRTTEYTMSASKDEGNKTGDDSVKVKGADGATGKVDATVLYKVSTPEASRIYKELGAGFEEKLIRPTIRTCMHEGYAGVNMIDAATTKRGTVETAVSDCIRKTIESRGFVLESTQLRKITLDESVQRSIDAKVAAQQAAEQKVFELQAASQEAEKQRISAKGLADAEQIIKCGATTTTQTNDKGETVNVAVPKDGASCENNLTPGYLQYQYIQSLKSLVDSPNNSTIILPFDQKLTPLLNLQQQGK